MSFPVLIAYVWLAFTVGARASANRWSIRKRLVWFVALTVPTGLMLYLLI